MSGGKVGRRWWLSVLLACPSASGCQALRALSERGTPDEVIQREAAHDQIRFMDSMHSLIGDRFGRIDPYSDL